MSTANLNVQLTFFYQQNCFLDLMGKMCRLVVVALFFTVPFLLLLILCFYVVFFAFTAVFG